MTSLLNQFGDCQDQASYAAAEQIVYKMQFVNKLLIASNHLEEKLLDY
jgi:hypothetical protein